MPRTSERSINTLQIARYDHGGGRIYFEDGSFRELIADTYDEDWREFLYNAIRSRLSATADAGKEMREAAIRECVQILLDDADTLGRNGMAQKANGLKRGAFLLEELLDKPKARAALERAEGGAK